MPLFADAVEFFSLKFSIVFRLFDDGVAFRSRPRTTGLRSSYPNNARPCPPQRSLATPALGELKEKGSFERETGWKKKSRRVGFHQTRRVDAHQPRPRPFSPLTIINRLRPTAAAAAASAPAASSSSSKSKPPSLLSSIDWRFVARHLPWLQSAVVVAITVLPLIVLEAAGKPRQRPFDVYDASISYSYHPDSVPTLVAVFVPVLGWLVTAAAVEFANARRIARTPGGNPAAAATAAATAVLYHTLDVVSCLLVTSLVTEATKLGVGRLRPYFLSACTPRDSAIEKLSIGDSRPPCDPVAGIQQRSARVSYPSGHSSTSMCTCAFAAFYVVWAVVLKSGEEGGSGERGRRGGAENGGAPDGSNGRERGGGPEISPPSAAHDRNGDFLRFVALLWALVLVGASWVIGATRITDNRHHPSDVVAGLGLGLLVGGLFFARSVGGRRALLEYTEGVSAKGGRRSSEAEALV